MVQGKALQKAGKFAEAIPYFEQAVDYGEGRFGDGHPKLAKALEWLANAHRQARNLEKAGPFYKRALEIWQNTRGPGHPKVGKILNSLGTLYRKQGRYGEAEKTLKRSLKVLENKLGKDHPQYAKTLDQLGNLYRELGRFEEAEKVLKQALAIRQRHKEPEHKASGSRSTTWPTSTATPKDPPRPKSSTPRESRSRKRTWARAIRPWPRPSPTTAGSGLTRARTTRRYPCSSGRSGSRRRRWALNIPPNDTENRQNYKLIQRKHRPVSHPMTTECRPMPTDAYRGNPAAGNAGSLGFCWALSKARRCRSPAGGRRRTSFALPGLPSARKGWYPA